MEQPFDSPHTDSNVSLLQKLTFCIVLHTIQHGFEVLLHYFLRLWSQLFEVLEM